MTALPSTWRCHWSKGGIGAVVMDHRVEIIAAMVGNRC